MTERRPHWDDDLIEAVRFNYNTQMHYADEQEQLESICDVIAAVEDWQRQRGPSLTEFIEMDEAIKRVRELRDRFRDHEKWVSYRNVETLLTRALDGETPNKGDQ